MAMILSEWLITLNAIYLYIVGPYSTIFNNQTININLNLGYTIIGIPFKVAFHIFWKLEDIIERPEQTIREVFDFLDVDPEVELDLKKIPKNSAKKSHLLSPEPLMRWVSSFLIDHDQAVLLHKIRNLGLKKILLNISTVDYPREPMNPETRDRLRRLFREDISELETLLDRDLTAWR